MKTILILAFLLFINIKNAVADPCGGKGVKQITSEISILLKENTICTSDSQEQHRDNGELWDYKKGSDDPIDQTSRVGYWSIHDDQVHYSYGDKVIFHYSVFFDGARICLFDGDRKINAFKIKGVSKPCPGF